MTSSAKAFIQKKKSIAKKERGSILVRCDETLEQDVKRIAQESGMSQNETIVTALEFFIQHYNVPKKVVGR
jgi:predicted HicB family RNase H-like nuclease